MKKTCLVIKLRCTLSQRDELEGSLPLSRPEMSSRCIDAIKSKQISSLPCDLEDNRNKKREFEFIDSLIH